MAHYCVSKADPYLRTVSAFVPCTASKFLLFVLIAGVDLRSVSNSKKINFVLMRKYTGVSFARFENKKATAFCPSLFCFLSVSIAYQMPLYPMLDDRDTDSSRDNHAPVWNTKRNHAAWALYLKGLADIPPYAAPARAADYTRLPPAYTFVGDIEPFYCETLRYIENLRAAGVEAKVDVYRNWFHAYDMFFPFKKAAKQAIREFEAQFVYAAEHYFAPQSKA